MIVFLISNSLMYMRCVYWLMTMLLNITVFKCLPDELPPFVIHKFLFTFNAQIISFHYLHDDELLSINFIWPQRNDHNDTVTGLCTTITQVYLHVRMDLGDHNLSANILIVVYIEMNRCRKIGNWSNHFLTLAKQIVSWFKSMISIDIPIQIDANNSFHFNGINDTELKSSVSCHYSGY